MLRPLLKKQIQYAQTQTKSHWAAARFLNASYTRYKKYAIAYGLFYNDHLNPTGKGVRRLKYRKTSFHKNSRLLQDIFDGKYPNYNRHKLFRRLVDTHLLELKCRYCGINHVRPNGKGPYKLDYVDGNGDNLALENLQVICLNCRYLTRGPVLIPEENNLSLEQDLKETGLMSDEDIVQLRNELQSDQFNSDD